uniref:Uncharacterized protein n=1 Tax=Anguilla anguilla TaxID=7936 RepID=A0A0E9QKT3_ANGAN
MSEISASFCPSWGFYHLTNLVLFFGWSAIIERRSV